ncbi:MAG: response regulator transcription factor [Acidobacterium ailaaui]|nr:response regulator transcription factor [Pseudacidobacterium ailaaui]MCL6464427.1 response regulator transcription factor [Pseudacidobacterium ailaaui]MDI3254906.1 response regulator transcription factor [Bacillota bacterium]
MRLLVADDDPALARFLCRGFEAEGHQVMLAQDGLKAMEMFVSEMPDLTVLDLDLPQRDGMEVLRFLRSVSEEAPVLVLTAREGIETRVRCLEMGADDYMLKPFSLRELRARCRSVMRRRQGAGLVLRYADLEVHRVERTAVRGGESVQLTNKEFALLEFLLLNRGRCVPRTDLLRQVWGMNPEAGTNVVDVYVNYLRRKLKDTGESALIQTIRGQGYSIGFKPTSQG